MSTEPAIVHYTAKTPNGSCTSIFLSALRSAYPSQPDLQSYQIVHMSGSNPSDHNYVKAPWFLAVNPNGRLPAVTVRGFRVFETSAILCYLAEVYDVRREFSFDPGREGREYGEMMQWLFFTHGGIGPMQGQAGHFVFAAPEKIEYAQKRYINETRRLYGVLEGQLKKGDKKYIVGENLTLVDFKTFPWIMQAEEFGIDLAVEFPAIQAWRDRIEARQDVQDGLKVGA
ncbi:glutathione S-transferase [Gymnopilus junonius]|uniref:Glutathione S-transferase n=1 Tax=Gymnopilus junonius TaxID=109634 RepID=A0A9P5NG88_GYMJU|nr:glutathione S-transferase [Gymnopilus junonius]